MTEVQVQYRVTQWLELHHYFWIHFPDSRRIHGHLEVANNRAFADICDAILRRSSRKVPKGGMTDLIAVSYETGRLLFIECKGTTGEVSPEQAAWMRALLKARAETWVVWGNEESLEDTEYRICFGDNPKPIGRECRYCRRRTTGSEYAA